MKTRSRFLVIAAVLLLVVANTGISCEEVAECLCDPTTDNPKVEAFFTAAADLRNASLRVRGKINEALADLAVAVGLERGASLAEIKEGVCTAFSAANITFRVEPEPARCEASVDVAAKAAAECDVTVDPGEVSVECEGRCHGTCRAQCTGECRMPSIAAYCEGSCHGSCYVESRAACSGICHGECDGTCSYMPEGRCAGTCDGVCTGRCETQVAGRCTGECYGECTVIADPGGCNGRCEGTCEGACEGRCEGTVRPPRVDADCEATVRARVEASVECEPPKLNFHADTSGVENIATISAQIGKIIAASAEAGKIKGAMEVYLTDMGTIAETVIKGELTADQVVCVLVRLGTAKGALEEALRAVVAAANASVTLLAPCE